MKKLVLLFVLVIMSFVCLVGCSNQSRVDTRPTKIETFTNPAGYSVSGGESLSSVNERVNRWIASKGDTIEVISITTDHKTSGQYITTHYYTITVVYKENK